MKLFVTNLGVFKLLIVGVFLLVGDALAAARKLPSPPSRPAGYVFLRDWAARNDFSLFFNPKEKTVLMTNRWARIELFNDARRGVINGVSVWLSFPISVYDGKLIVNQKDITTCLNPVLFPPKVAKGKKIRLIAVDAGHGGKDPGYQIGENQEKKYTLALAKEVEEQLARVGLKSYMTRRSDKFVDLVDRAVLADRAKADLFVSVHYNCAYDPNAKGVETFTATPFGAESTAGEEALRSYAGNRFDAQSMLLAYEVQRSVTRSIEVADRGVRRAGFVVLRRVSMPGILVEGGFMSNASDAKKVFSEEERRELARAIVDGILAYKRTVERN